MIEFLRERREFTEWIF